MHFWDWRSGYNFQKLNSIAQPGSINSEAGIFALAFDHSGSRLVSAEADKSIKIYKEDETAVSIVTKLCVYTNWLFCNVLSFSCPNRPKKPTLPTGDLDFYANQNIKLNVLYVRFLLH